MICDHLGCKNSVKWAPRLFVPPRMAASDMRPIRMMTTLHYCDLHRGELSLSDLLNGKLKARIEAHALKHPAFDAALPKNQPDAE